MRWPVTEPRKFPLPRWLPLAAATVVGVAGLAAVAAAVACRRPAAAEEPAPPAEPPPPDPPRFLESLLGALSAEKPAPSVQPPRPVASPLPPEDPKSRRSRVIILSLVAAVVWLWVAVQVYEVIAGPAHEPRPSSDTEISPVYLIEP
jgi:hypothetical protein